jgi:tetratricopeptide (TPR) repeat protein
MRNYSVFLIVLATCALALGPFCAVLVGPSGYARWMLAHAANEFQHEKPIEAEAILQKAIDASREIAADPEYWDLRFQLVFDKTAPDAAKIASLKEDAIRFLSELEDRERYVASLIVSNLFQENDQYTHAIDVLQTLYPQFEKRTAGMNNNIAYFRSLLGQDLALALSEINFSLESDASAGSMDTKAWILHGLGRDTEALKFANKGLEMVYKSLANGDLIAIDQKIQLISDPSEAKLFARMFAPDLNTIKKKAQGNEPDVPNPQPQDEADLDAILKGMSEDPKASPSNPAPAETRPQGLEPLEMIKNRYPQIDPFLIEGIAKTIAVMRYHRACILHDLGRFDEWERDHTWLELFGFEDTAKLK